MHSAFVVERFIADVLNVIMGEDTIQINYGGKSQHSPLPDDTASCDGLSLHTGNLCPSSNTRAKSHRYGTNWVLTLLVRLLRLPSNRSGSRLG